MDVVFVLSVSPSVVVPMIVMEPVGSLFSSALSDRMGYVSVMSSPIESA